MQQNAQPNLALPVLVILCLAAAVISIAAFWGWVKFGTDILLSAGETALSWCF